LSTVGLTREQVGRLFPAYMETDADLQITAVGASLQRLIGGPLIGRKLTELLGFDLPRGPQDIEAWARQGRDLQARVLPGGLKLRGVVVQLSAGYLFCLSHAVGRPQDLLQRGLRMDDFSPADGGLPLALALGLKDELLSETRDLIADVARARDAALAGSRAKSAFLANMSHEFRTPLNGVTGVAGALARTRLSAEQKRLLSVIQASGQTLERLLSDVLDIAQAESGRLTLHMTPFDLRSALEAAVFPLGVLAKEKGLSFNLVFDLDEHPSVVADETRLKQLVVCLVSNAVKFTPQGGVFIHVVCDVRPDGELIFTLSVTDTGVGFEDDKLSALYAPFAPQPADRSSGGGLGLGLSIAKALCDLMGGHIEATSRRGLGSTIQVTLPLHAAPPKPVSGSSGLAASNDVAPPLRVLLAEDHPTNQTVVRLILEPLQADLTIASDGLEALERFKAAAFDVVLADMRMPGLNGLELASAIRSLEFAAARPRTPIIMVSADALPEHRQAGLAAGADLYLAKPITPETLLQAIDQALSVADPALEL